jgi:hypothetical protein
MSTDAEGREIAGRAGAKYGTMAADLCLLHLNSALDGKVAEEHIKNLAYNIREQALLYDNPDFAQVWKDAALKAAQARLAAVDKAEEPT